MFFGLFALFFVNAQYLQYAKGHSPLVTGIAILPLPITVIVVSRRSVALAARIGTRTVVTGGMILLAAGLAAMSFMTAATSYLPYGLALLVIAVGMGLSVPSLSTGIVTSLPPAQAGTGSGLNSAVREIGSALGVAVIGTILTSKFASALPAELQGHTESTSQTLRAAQATRHRPSTPRPSTPSPTRWPSASVSSPPSFSSALSWSQRESTPAEATDPGLSMRR